MREIIRYRLFLIAGLLLASCATKSESTEDIELGMSSDYLSTKIPKTSGVTTLDSIGGISFDGKFKMFNLDGAGKLGFDKDGKLFLIGWHTTGVSDSTGKGIISLLKQKLGDPEIASDTLLRWKKNSIATVLIHDSGLLDYYTADMAAVQEYNRLVK
jgi:hypothetical protein